MDNYEIMQVLGRGGFGCVRLARRKSDGVCIVLKHVEGAEPSNITEVRALATFQHPLIVRYHESFIHEGGIIIAMEYVSGGTLYDLLKRSLNPFDEDQVIFILAQLVTALHHMHSKRVLHRDLTPRNVLLSQDYKLVKLADLGLSKLLQSRSRARSIVGTPEYLSPELCQGQEYGVQSDVWALGCIVYQMLTLQPPFKGHSIPALVLAILNGNWKPPSKIYSKEMHALVRGMLTNDPEIRIRLCQIAASPKIALALVKLSTELGAYV